MGRCRWAPSPSGPFCVPPAPLSGPFPPIRVADWLPKLLFDFHLVSRLVVLCGPVARAVLMIVALSNLEACLRLSGLALKYPPRMVPTSGSWS